LTTYKVEMTTTKWVNVKLYRKMVISNRLLASLVRKTREKQIDKTQMYVYKTDILKYQIKQ
jgi:hypothetical protein